MQNREQEHGIALITVLALISSIGILVASAVAISQYSTAETDTFSSLLRSSLEAESVANRTLCLLLADRAKYSDRKLGLKGGESEKRFLADGTEHFFVLDNRNIKVRIFDGIAGLDLSGRNPGRQLKYSDSERNERYEQLAAQLEDYVDSDDLVKAGGMEAQHYRDAGIPVLPRNRPVQFREELLWLQNMKEIYPPSDSGLFDAVRLIPPEKMRALTGRPSLYATPISVISERCQLTDEESLELQRALILWQSEQTPLADILSPGLLGRLEMNFSTRESGVYTIRVDTSSQENPGRRLSVTIRPIAGDRNFEYYEFFYY